MIKSLLMSGLWMIFTSQVSSHLKKKMPTPSLLPWTCFRGGISSTHLMQCNIRLLVFPAIYQVNRRCLCNRMEMTVSNGSTSLATLIIACTMRMLTQASSQTSVRRLCGVRYRVNWSGSAVTTDTSMYNMLNQCKVFMMRLKSKNLTSLLFPPLFFLVWLAEEVPLYLACTVQ